MNTKAAVKTALEQTIVVVAAGGDASRLMPGFYLDRLHTSDKTDWRVPLWVCQYSLATQPIASTTEVTFLQVILSSVLKNLGQDTPVAVITGPNTHEAICAHLDEHNQMGLRHLAVIQQGALPVFTPEGELLCWEDGSPLEAPDGTAGCLLALEDAEPFEQWVKAGYRYAFLWYGNDLASGMHIAEFYEQAIDACKPLYWASDPMGHAILNQIHPRISVAGLRSLVAELEDAPGTYILQSQTMGEVLKIADWHTVRRPVPILLPNGELLQGIKRELFLCDAVWKAHLWRIASRAPAQTAEPVERPASAAEGQPPASLRRGFGITAQEALSFKSKPAAGDLAIPSEPIGEFPPLFLDGLGTAGQKRLQGTSRFQQVSMQILENLLSRGDEVLAALETGQDVIQRIEWNIGKRSVGQFLVDDYEILKVIESGGMGIVYICQDREYGDLVAVKTFRDEIRWTRPKLVQRFWHEANYWVTIPPHPNIVQAHQVREIDGRLHIFIEYVEGGSLRDRLRQKPISVPEGLELGLQVCDGLDVIHSAGMIHRDIKPENILLTGEGEAKIMDLGLVATLYDKHLKEPAGTPLYTSNGRDLDFFKRLKIPG